MSAPLVEPLRLLTPSQAFAVAETYGTPAYVYGEDALRAAARAVKAFPNAFGLTARFAMKASPNAAILQLFHQEGLHFDCSSGFEAARALRAGIPASHLSLSSQEFPENFAELHRAGMTFNACSLAQLRRFGELFPGGTCGLRFNPGLGSGGTNRTNVGGPASSFGIWHEFCDEAVAMAKSFNLNIFRIHTHIGSGSDPAVWQKVAAMNLDLVRRFPSVTHLNLGGGFKVGRMSHEKSTDLQLVGTPVRAAFEEFAKETGRKLHLEIEPGTYLMANQAVVVSTIRDLVHTGEGGYRFLKIDSGMTEVLRPSLYGAQHPLAVVSRKPTGHFLPYVVAGHCCESGDIMTPAPGQPEELAPRELDEAAIGDLLVIGGSGAYCAGMAAKNYNSFPEAPEVLLRTDGTLSLIRQRQPAEQVTANERPVSW